MESTPELEEQIDDVYAAPLEEFTARRNELAKELRAGGEKDAAEAVRRLPKPTLAAWVVNQLARCDRRDVDLLLDAGHRLRRVQGGGRATRDQLDDAVRAERDALQRLLAVARTILSERGRDASSGVLERVSRTLRAASASDEGRELLARGRLTTELESSGFELLAPFAAEGRPRSRETTPNRKEEVKAARQRADDAATRAREVKKELASVERELAEARIEADRLAEHVDEVRAELEAAERVADEAREELRRLQRRARRS